MDWINLQLQKLRERHRRVSKEATIKAQLKQEASRTGKGANGFDKKAKEEAAKIGQELKDKGAGKAETVDKIGPASPGGTKPSGSYNYQPKGLPPRGKGKGKGRGR